MSAEISAWNAIINIRKSGIFILPQLCTISACSAVKFSPLYVERGMLNNGMAWKPDMFFFK